MIDFESEESHVLLNPRLPADERERLGQNVPPLRGHVFVATSGSTGGIKLVALSKAALLASAAAVNDRFAVTDRDLWCAVLPFFHVGGLGIYARAHLSRARVIGAEWEPRSFVETCSREGVTVASLVPTQVFDLVRHSLRPSEAMRAVLVGGAHFSPDIAASARELGWPVYASYGASECSSTIAVEPAPGAQDLIVLPHLEAAVAQERLAFRGKSLLTGYVVDGELVDPKVDGWFVSEDVGDVDGVHMRVIGRAADFVKIGGEAVDLSRLDAILRRIAGDSAAVVAVPDERLGHVIHLVTVGEGWAIRKEFDRHVLPFERARALHRVDAIPRSPLGKLLRAQLAAEITA